MDRHAMLLGLGLISGVLVLPCASGATWTWAGGSAAWDNSTTAVWAGATAPGVPAGGDTVNLTHNTAGDIAVDFASTAMAGTYGTASTWYGPVTLGNAGGGTTTLQVGTGDSLFVNPLTVTPGGKLSVSGGLVRGYGTATKPTTTLTATGGAIDFTGGTVHFFTLDANGSAGPVQVTFGSGSTVSLDTGYMPNSYVGGGANAVTVTESGGNVTGCNLTIGANTAYTLSSGTLTMHNLYVNSGAVLTQNGGALADMTWDDGFRVRSGGTFNFNAGTLPTAAGAKFTVEAGGILNLTGVLDTLGTASVLQGVGTFDGVQYGLNGVGRVIADGRGTPGDLDIAYGYVVSWRAKRPFTDATENPTSGTRGWYAVNKGRLILPRTGSNTGGCYQPNWVRSANGTSYTIGDSWDDTTPDLVNSAKVVFTGLSDNAAGFITETLYAPDRADVPAMTGVHHMVGVYDFSLTGNTYTSYDLTIRYDQLSASVWESYMRLYHYNGSSWVDVTATLDTTNKWITATGQTSFSLFAIGAVPEPASGALFLGLLLACRRRARR